MSDLTPEQREALTALIREAKDAHVWEPYECRCSCGVVPPVVGAFHQVDRHEDMALADALAPTIARLLAEREAEALERAADEFPPPGSSFTDTGRQLLQIWLRNRATEARATPATPAQRGKVEP